MVKLRECKPPAVSELLKHRVVCDVCESHHISLYGEFVNWRGSTETEYFSIIFLKGILTVSIDEREMKVGWEPVNFAISSKLADMFASVKGDLEQTAMAAKYSREEYQKELDNISFTDVMVALSWKYAPNAKIDYNPLAP